jgi:hypothetical protein
MSLAHDTHMVGYLGFNKTCTRILSHFYWPMLRGNVSEISRTYVCQMIGKPNQKIPSAPL